MASTFSTIQTNVGNNIQDTSNEMNTIIGVYINNRYRDILRRINWETIDDDYTFPTVAGTADYVLPTDFKKEIYVFDTTSKKQLSRMTLQDYAENNLESDYGTTGDPKNYSIFNYMTTDSTPLRKTKIRIEPTPSSAHTILVPYTIEPSDLSGSNYPVVECELALEYGATADSWKYKRQFSKASDFEAKYEREIINLIWNKENQPNMVRLFAVKAPSRDLY